VSILNHIQNFLFFIVVLFLSLARFGEFPVDDTIFFSNIKVVENKNAAFILTPDLYLYTKLNGFLKIQNFDDYMDFLLLTDSSLAIINRNNGTEYIYNIEGDLLWKKYASYFHSVMCSNNYLEDVEYSFKTIQYAKYHQYEGVLIGSESSFYILNPKNGKSLRGDNFKDVQLIDIPEYLIEKQDDADSSTYVKNYRISNKYYTVKKRFVNFIHLHGSSEVLSDGQHKLYFNMKNPSYKESD